MTVELNKDQYRQLLKMVYIAEWIVNSYKNKEEEYEFTDIEQHIYSYFGKFGCDDFIEYDEEHEMWFPTSGMDDAVLPFIDEFLEANKGDFIGFN